MTPCEPKAPQAHIPEPTLPKHRGAPHHHPVVPTTDISPQHPAVTPAGRGGGGGRKDDLAVADAAHRKRDLGARITPCAALLSAAMTGEAKQHSLLGRDGARWGRPILLQQGGLPGCTVTEV